MAGVKITKTATVDLGIIGPTAGDLIDTLRQVPEDAKYSVKAYKADPREPRDHDWAQLIFSWTD